MKVAHLADIHIRNNERHEEYRHVFAHLSDSLRESGADLVVVSGDIFHSKTVLSPESVHMFFEFIATIPDEIPIIMIVGNHDASISSKGDRLDAITPLIPKIQRTGKVIYSNSTESFQFCGHTWFHYSCLDNDVLPDEFFQNAIGKKILLYHGIVGGTKSYTGFSFDGTHQDKRIDFDRFDLGMLGDIHITSEPKPMHFYPSSLVCQNFGEHPINHGYALWDLNTDKKPTYKKIRNDYGHYTIRIPSLNFDPICVDFDGIHTIPPYARVRVQYHSSLKKLDVQKEIELTLPATVSIIYEAFKGDEISMVHADSIKQDIQNLHDLTVQDLLFREYFESYPEEMVSDLVSLNRKMNLLASDKVESKMNKNRWRLLGIEFSNLFSYGEGNTVDFTTVSGVCGSFASNASGKTSFLNAIPFIIFGEFPKMTTLDSALNDQSDNASGRAILSSGNSTFEITRTLKRTKKGASQTLTFIETKEDGTQVNHTEEVKITQKKINDLFGDLDSYVKSSYMAQRGAPMFLDLTPAPRKEWFNKNLGLEFFSALNEAAKSESEDKRSKINVLKNMDFVSEEMRLLSEMNLHKDELKVQEVKLRPLQENRDRLMGELEVLKNELSKTLPPVLDPTQDIEVKNLSIQKIQGDIVTLKSDDTCNSRVNSIEKEYEMLLADHETLLKVETDSDPNSHSSVLALQSELDQIKSNGKKGKDRLLQIKTEHPSLSTTIDELKETIETTKSKIQEVKDKLVVKNHTLSTKKRELENTREESKILDTDPRFTTEDLCKTCPLIDNALTKKDLLPSLEKEVTELQNEINALTVSLKDLELRIAPEGERLSSLNEILTELQNLEVEQTNLKAQYTKTNLQIENRIAELTQLRTANIDRIQKQIASIEANYTTATENALEKLNAEVERLVLDLEKEKHALSLLEERKKEFEKYEKQKLERDQTQKKFTEISVELQPITEQIEQITNEITSQKITIGVYEQRIKDNEAKQKEYEALLADYKVYELYLQATDKGGIPYFYVQKILQSLEDEVNNILSTIVDFSIVLTADETKVDCSLTSPSKGNWRSDLLSGMETFMVNLAFRLGIAEIANISQPNFMVVDEGFGVLDSDHVSETPKLFALLKSKLDFILMVSHNQIMQDYVDHQFTIDRVKGKSYISL